jgi:hypothetical protein
LLRKSAPARPISPSFSLRSRLTNAALSERAIPTQAFVGAADRAALEKHAVARDRLHRTRAANGWGKLQKTQR